jgi:phenylacetate-CoA ligase
MDFRLTWDILARLRALRQHEHWTRPQVAAFQAEAAQRLRHYATAHSPFYQRFHRGLADRPLSELPVLTKAMLMEHFDELVTDRRIRLADIRAYAANADGRRFLDRYWLNATSGSSGHPGFFLFNRTEWATVLASFARSHEWAGVRVSLTHRVKMASVASTSSWHMSSQVAATLPGWLRPTLRLAASQPLPEIVARLNAWQPEMLVTYASMARILANEQLSGRLRIQPQLVFTSSEVLTEETRHHVAAAWGQPPFNEYATTESGGLAAECQQCRKLHLFEDLVLVEVVDHRHRPVPPGEYGEKLLLTVLFNHTQPLIRYELSDSLQLATDPCGCRSPFAQVAGIQGRTEEVLSFPASAGGEVSIHPLLFHHILDTMPASGWQVVQTADGLRVLLSGLDNGQVTHDDIENSLKEALTAQGVRLPPIQVQSVATIPKTVAGKAPLVRSELEAAGPAGLIEL